MKCPRCSATSLSVVDSRGDGNSIRRRRQCQSCEYRFTTYERIERSLPMVVKKDGRREVWDRQKIMSGLIKACEKRPIGMEQLDKTADDIEGRVAELCEKEITSREVGDYLMDELKKLDKIAYVRFASVYREFSDVSQFEDALHSLKDRAKAPRRRRAEQTEEFRPE